MSDEKVVTDQCVTRDKGFMYISQFCQHRKQIKGVNRGKPISKQTLLQDIKAIVDLQCTQKTQGLVASHEPSPRQGAIGDVIANFSSRKNRESKASAADSATARLALGPGYSKYQHEQLMTGVPFHNAEVDGGLIARLTAFHVLGHACCVRCDDRLNLKLGGVFVQEHPLPGGDGVVVGGQYQVPCPLLCLVSDAGKRNQEGALNVLVTMNHKQSPTLSVPFQVGLLLHQILTIEQNPTVFLPRRDTSTNVVTGIPWQDNCLFPARGRGRNRQADFTKPMSDVTFRDGLKKGFAQTEPPILSHKVTHLSRIVSNTTAKMGMVGADDRRQAGGWTGDDTSVMTTVYEKGIAGAPYPFIRRLAEQSPHNNEHIAPHALLNAPPSLSCKVFPHIGELKEAVSNRDVESRATLILSFEILPAPF